MHRRACLPPVQKVHKGRFSIALNVLPFGLFMYFRSRQALGCGQKSSAQYPSLPKLAFHFFPYRWAMIWRWRWIKFKVVLALAAVRSVLRMSMIVVNSPWVRFVANTGSSSVSVTSVWPQKLHVVVGIGGSMLHAARLAIDLFRFDRT